MKQKAPRAPLRGCAGNPAAITVPISFARGAARSDEELAEVAYVRMRESLEHARAWGRPRSEVMVELFEEPDIRPILIGLGAEKTRALMRIGERLSRYVYEREPRWP